MHDTVVGCFCALDTNSQTTRQNNKLPPVQMIKKVCIFGKASGEIPEFHTVHPDTTDGALTNRKSSPAGHSRLKKHALDLCGGNISPHYGSSTNNSNLALKG